MSYREAYCSVSWVSCLGNQGKDESLEMKGGEVGDVAGECKSRGVS